MHEGTHAVDWTQLAHESSDAKFRTAAGSPENIDLLADGAVLGRCSIAVRDASVAVLSWDLGDGAINALAGSMRELVRALYERTAITRVEVVVDAGENREVQVAMRTGLRREGVLRGGLHRDGGLRDGALFASIAGDPTPDAAGGFTYMLDSVMPLKRLISHVVMSDPAGRILLCKTTFKKDWELPGGIAELGESPVLAAQREVAEEIGMDLVVGRLLVLDWLPPHLGWSDAIEVLYDGGVHDVDLPDRLKYDAREIVSAAWFTAEELVEVVSPLNAKRLPLLTPRKPERTLHLEGGELAE